MVSETQQPVESPEVLYHYSAYGLRFQSSFPIPELMVVDGTANPDVVIRYGNVSLPEALVDRAGTYSGTEETAIITWPNFGAFQVQGGCEITVDAVSGANMNAMRVPLLGSVLGVLLHQRGLFTLHASAVSVDGEVVAFVGAKGAGKSTIAAALHRAGHTLFVDDILAIDRQEGGRLYVYSGFPQLKLWPASMSALDHDPENLAELHPDYKKRGFRPTRGFEMSLLPVSRIYVLEEGPAVACELLSSREAFMQLVAHSYAARFIGKHGAGPGHFQQCQELAKQLPVYTLKRPHDLAQLDATIALIENEVRSAQAV